MEHKTLALKDIPNGIYMVKSYESIIIDERIVYILNIEDNNNKSIDVYSDFKLQNYIKIEKPKRKFMFNKIEDDKLRNGYRIEIEGFKKTMLA